MSAQRQPLPEQPSGQPNQHQQPKKPAKRKILKANAPDLTVAPRSLTEIDAPFRGGNNWTAIPRSFDSDRVRLASGSTFWALTTYITHLSGRDRKAGEKLSFEAEISIPEAALWCRCNERSIDRELLYLSQRDMAIVSRLAGRKVVVRLAVWPEQLGDKVYPGWADIPQSYAEWAASQRQSLDDQLAEKQQEKDNPVLRLKKIRVKPGHQSEPEKLDTHVENWRVKCAKDSPLDIELSGKVVSGELVLSVSGVAQEALRSKRDAKAVYSTSSDKTSRHTRLENAKLPANEGRSEYPYSRVHARAEEIARLWDPILYRKIKKTLTGDKQSLRSACVASDACPIEIIEQRVRERAQRPIKKTSDAIGICREIRINWEKGTALAPEPQKIDPAKVIEYDPLAEMRKRGKKHTG